MDRQFTSFPSSWTCKQTPAERLTQAAAIVRRARQAIDGRGMDVVEDQ
jgi:hypothetical protein